MGWAGDDDGFSIMELIGNWLGLPDEITDFVERQMDENRAEAAIEEAIAEMESMIGSAGQGAIMDEVFAVFGDAAFRVLNGGGSLYTEIRYEIGSDKMDAVSEIVAEGEALFFDAIGS